MIEIKQLSKSFSETDKQEIRVLENIDLSVNEGEFVSVIGPNGCGKSTLLNIISGLLEADSGSILINKKNPKKSKIGFVFQNYRDTLFPWMKNISNISFGLKTDNGIVIKNKKKYVQEYINNLNAEKLIPLNKYPYQCSGGQQQLVAILRELIYQPEVLLLDEPFAALDYERRLEQQRILMSFWEKAKTSVLFVSHEIEEAIFMSDKVVLLSNRPARIKEIFTIDIERPRDLSSIKTEQFFKLKKEILESFLEVSNI